jgi:glutamine cyclotransferase
MLSIRTYLSFLWLLTLFACNNSNSTDTGTNVDVNPVIPTPSNLLFDIIKTYPHDTSSYTQGLEWNGNVLIESTGNYKESKLRLLDTNMKDIVSPVKLEDIYFGEGATLFNNKIYQLTWKENKVFVYDAKTLKKITEYYWPYEGWGMTHNDTAIIVNTGGSNLYYVDPSNFKVIKTVGVYDHNGYVSNVNELEYVDGKIYANVYLTDDIIQIDPVSGRVLAKANLTNILTKAGINDDPKVKDPGNVLNGIAYNKNSKTFFITGKDWPALIELKFR